jgi:Fe-S-cluster-containing hydrogenase component 2
LLPHQYDKTITQRAIGDIRLQEKIKLDNTNLDQSMETRSKNDLFRFKWLHRLFYSPLFPLIFQILMLIVFILLVVGSVTITTIDPKFAMTLRNTNLANLLVWSYWWPIIIISAIFLGRYWCIVCPVELITSLFSRIGLKRKPSQFLRSGWAITLFYGLILFLGVHMLAIHRYPQRMAFFLLTLIAVSIVAGSIWEKRTFCTYLCPVGHLLGLYAMFSMTEYRVKSQAVCKQCKTKDCIDKKRHYNITAKSCTSELYPATITDNKKCLACSQCKSACPNDNLSLLTRKPGKDLFSNLKFSSAELGFIIILTGFVNYEILSSWKVTKKILMVVPTQVSSFLGLSGIAVGGIKSTILFLLFPLLFFALFIGLKKLFSKGNQESIKQSMSFLALAILPVIASMHLLKGILKSTSRIPYWPYALTDSSGIETAKAIIANPALLNKSFINQISPFITTLAILLSLLGLFMSYRLTVKKQDRAIAYRWIEFSAAFVYFGIYFVTIFVWRVI